MNAYDDYLSRYNKKKRKAIIGTTLMIIGFSEGLGAIWWTALIGMSSGIRTAHFITASTIFLIGLLTWGDD